jgi:hypothetical protein
VLRTVGDAVAYMTALPKHRETRQAWQHACKLMITRQISLALSMDAKLDLGHKHARAKSTA